MAVLILVSGIALVIGGTWGCLTLGLLLARHKTGLAVYALTVLFVLAWGVWEVGLYLRGLAPRGGVVALLGLLLLLPPVVRGLRRGTQGFRGYGVEGLSLVGALAVAAVVGVAALATQSRNLSGRFAAERVVEAADTGTGAAEPGEWPAYGRTDAGRRHSPLDQITPENVSELEIAWECHAGDPHVDQPGTALESTPLIVNNTMYLCTPESEIIALDRRTGEPILPVEEVPVPQDAVAGETPAPTQPVSAISFKPDYVTGADTWGVSPVDQMMCRIRLAELEYEGRFTPPTTNGTLTHLGSFGIFNWGGVAIDPERDVLFAMPVYLGFVSRLIPRPDSLEEIVSAPGYPMGNENFGTPYAAVLKPFMSALGLPCQAPPWGYVAGVDLTTGETVYQHVNGTVRDMAPVPLPFETGVPRSRRLPDGPRRGDRRTGR